MEDAPERGDLLRDRLHPLAPGVEDLARALDREEEDAGIQLGRLVELQLDRGHDPEAPPAAADGPEQVGLVVSICADENAVRRDELDGRDAVRGETAAAGEPAHAAAERVADDADVGRRPVQHDEALLGGRLDDVPPYRPRLDADAARLGVDRHVPQALRLDENRFLELLERRGAVARSLRRDPQPVDVSELDDGHDVGSGLDERDREGALVDGEVPGLPGAVPVGVVGKHEIAVQPQAKRADVDAARGLDIEAQGGHWDLLSVVRDCLHLF